VENIISKNSSSNVLLGVGDDAAAFESIPGFTQLISSDSQVEGVHFDLDWIDPNSLGKRAISVSFSDIAAMGGRANFAIVSLILPDTLTLEFFKYLYTGIAKQTGAFMAQVIGGNISRGSDKLIIDITVLGEIMRDTMVTRTNAKVGDHIYVTGLLGNGVAGLSLLRKFGLKFPPKFKNIVGSYLNPEARMSAGVQISSSEYASSMIDISDGLSSDLGHICKQSQVGAEISFDLLPRDPLLKEISSITGVELIKMILHGGDCYELLFTLKPDTPINLIKSISDDSGISITRIGSIMPKNNGMTLSRAENITEILKPKGWNHFK